MLKTRSVFSRLIKGWLDMAKKVLIISQNFYPEIGSAGNRIKNIYLLLKKNGYDVQVITTEPTYPNKKIYQDKKFWDDGFINQQESSDIKRIKVRNRKYTRRVLNRLWYYLEVAMKILLHILYDKTKYDVIFVTSPPIFIGIVGLFAKFHYRSKMILDIRDLWPESLKGVNIFNYPIIISIFSKVASLLYKRADSLVVNSRGFIGYITNVYQIPFDKIVYIPNAARENEIVKKQYNNQFKVIYAGNIGLAQDCQLLMELAKELQSKSIQLNIIGYGMKKNDLIKYVKSNKLSNIHFIEACSRKECMKIIANSHVGVVTLNDKEVFETVLPGKVIDYMTCNVPIIASVSGSSKEIIEHGNVGRVSESRDINEILEYIFYLYDNPTVQKEISENGQRYVKKHFLWEKNIRLLINLIENKDSLDKVESL